LTPEHTQFAGGRVRRLASSTRLGLLLGDESHVDERADLHPACGACIDDVRFGHRKVQRRLEIVVTDPAVSRRHALIRATLDGVEVVPLGRFPRT
jgi:hypothetical protein